MLRAADGVTVRGRVAAMKSYIQIVNSFCTCGFLRRQRLEFEGVAAGGEADFDQGSGIDAAGGDHRG